MKRLFSCGNCCDFKNKDTCHKTKETVAISQLKILPVLFLSIREESGNEMSGSRVRRKIK